MTKKFHKIPKPKSAIFADKFNGKRKVALKKTTWGIDSKKKMRKIYNR